MIQDANFYVCNRCGQKVFNDFRSIFHIHPPTCHTQQVDIVLPAYWVAEPEGIAACI